jgi:rhodanese-related sulfurtransferase
MTSTPLLAPDQTGTTAVLDVRQASEFHTGHLPGAAHIELGELPGQSVPGPVVTMCGHGERAMTAASILERSGHPAVGVLDGGPQDWADATGTALA